MGNGKKGNCRYSSFSKYESNSSQEYKESFNDFPPQTKGCAK